MSDSKSIIPSLSLNDGREIPQLGLGVYKLSDEETYSSIRTAIDLGIRHLDTAAFYNNEEVVGRAVADAIADGDVAREEMFITTKVWNADQGYERVLEACQESLIRLNMDYIDLYLIHWPGTESALYLDTWRALETLHEQGKAASIGVCNFYPEALQNLIENSTIVPAVNQVELHPGFSQPEVQKYDAQQGILTEAWAPLARGTNLKNPVLVSIAEAHHVTPAQVSIRWNLQLGNSAIPRSSKPERLRENFDVFGFTLSEEEMQRITAMDAQGGRLSGDPHTFITGFPYDTAEPAK